MSQSGDPSTQDFHALRLQHYDWSTPQGAREAVQSIHDLALEHALGTIRWYYRKRKRFRSRAQGLRFTATILAILGGLMPLLQLNFGAVLTKAGYDPTTLSHLGYLFFGLAAALLAFNNYLGYSSAWIRHVLAALKIKRLVEDFQFSWMQQIAGLNTAAKQASDPQPEAQQATPAPEQAQPASDPAWRQEVEQLLQLVHHFSDQLNELALQETETWAAEFSRDLSSLESLVKKEHVPLSSNAAPRANPPGGSP
ncbi:MAG: SLATT domain-containing protein [Acidobacteriota bacterium]